MDYRTFSLRYITSNLNQNTQKSAEDRKIIFWIIFLTIFFVQLQNINLTKTLL